MYLRHVFVPFSLHLCYEWCNHTPSLPVGTIWFRLLQNSENYLKTKESFYSVCENIAMFIYNTANQYINQAVLPSNSFK